MIMYNDRDSDFDFIGIIPTSNHTIGLDNLHKIKTLNKCLTIIF